MGKWNIDPSPTQAQAILGNSSVNHKFLFNPDEVKWGVNNNTVSRDTIGGRVVQLLSSKVEQMSVIGRAGSRDELQRLAQNVKKIMDWQVKTQSPVHFKVPSRKWNFKVYVQNVSSLGWDYAATAYPYEITLQVQQDLTGLTSKIIEKETLSRLAQGIGYTEKYHGGSVEGALEVSEAMLNSVGFLKDGGSNSGSGTTSGDGTVSGTTTGGENSPVTKQLYQGRTDLWQPGVANLPWKGSSLREAVTNMMEAFVRSSEGGAGFTATDVQVGLCVIKHESGWDPSSTYKNTNGTIDYGLWQMNSSHSNTTWWPKGNVNLLLNPEYNTRCALSHWIIKGWKEWNAYKNSDNGCQPQ